MSDTKTFKVDVKTVSAPTLKEFKEWCKSNGEVNIIYKTRRGEPHLLISCHENIAVALKSSNLEWIKDIIPYQPLELFIIEEQ